MTFSLKFECGCYVIKELVHAFSCVYIELWMQADVYWSMMNESVVFLVGDVYLVAWNITIMKLYNIIKWN